MMNKSKIDWCDFSWNPVTGCLHKCDYCYARKQARRFCGDIRLNKGTGQIKQYIGDDMTSAVCYTLEKPFKNAEGETVGFPVGFAPILHEYRLTQPAQKKKPANIFVCSMADLFGEWVPESWIERVFEACEAAPWHNYLFLTKKPTAILRPCKQEETTEARQLLVRNDRHPKRRVDFRRQYQLQHIHQHRAAA